MKMATAADVIQDRKLGVPEKIRPGKITAKIRIHPRLQEEINLFKVILSSETILATPSEKKKEDRKEKDADRKYIEEMRERFDREERKEDLNYVRTLERKVASL